MAITKLMHMKESPGCPHDHLRNAIDYVLDVEHGGEKTKHGQLVGGNCGLDHKEILENFLATKRDFGKLDGRQGYHFVISFAKGETDEATAFAVVREFCEAYLGDTYDYVYALHNDKEHLHGHIIFNSVARTDGYKYHYKQGDWKACIQPITDRVCEAHGLQPLTFDEEERVGVSYASWAAEHEGAYNWSHIIRADADYAIQKADSFEDFQELMQRMGYQLRIGYSKKQKTSYIAFQFVSVDGKTHKRRSYNLPPGYSPKEILERIQTKEGSRSYEEIVRTLGVRAKEHLQYAALRSTQTYQRLYQAVNYYQLPNPYAIPAGRVRKDMLRLERLLDDCRYLKTHHITEERVLKERAAVVSEQIRQITDERKLLYALLDMAGQEETEQMGQYRTLQEALQKSREDGDYRWETLEDEMAALRAGLPDELLEAKDRIEAHSRELKALRKEKRILDRIIQTEQEHRPGQAQRAPEQEKKTRL